MEINKALKTDPNNVDGILLRAVTEAVDNLDQGLAILEAAIARLESDKKRQLRALRTRDRAKGRAILEGAIARLVETDKTRQLRELRVMLLAEGKRLPELEQGLLGLIAEFPEKREYQYELAQFYTDEGRIDEADALLRTLALGNKAQGDDRLVYVQFLSTSRGPAEAEAMLKQFIKESPADSMLQLALGQLYLDNKRPEDARAVYRQLSKRDPKSAEGLAARNRLAALEIRVGNMDQALAVMDSVLTDAPDEPTALLLRAGARYVEKKYDQAIADLRLVLRRDTGNERALLLMALAHLQTNDTALAKDAYQRLLNEHPNSVEGIMQLAALYAGENNFREAEALLRRRVGVQPDDLLASGRLVEMLIAQGNTAAAEAEARRMASLQTQGGVGDFSLGRVLFSRGDFSGAAEAYRRTTQQRKDDPVALESLAESLERSGNSQEAISILNTEIGRQQNQLLARFLLAGIYSRRGEPNRAAEYFESVIRQRPKLQYAYISLSAVYPNDRDKRIEIMERGLAAIPGDPALSMLLGSELDRGGEYEKADQGLRGAVGQAAEFRTRHQQPCGDAAGPPPERQGQPGPRPQAGTDAGPVGGSHGPGHAGLGLLQDRGLQGVGSCPGAGRGQEWRIRPVPVSPGHGIPGGRQPHWRKAATAGGTEPAGLFPGPAGGGGSPRQAHQGRLTSLRHDRASTGCAPAATHCYLHASRTPGGGQFAHRAGAHRGTACPGLPGGRGGRPS